MTKYLIFCMFLILGLMFVVLNKTSYAQDSLNEAAEKYGVSFPISELGSCKDYYECRNYCEDPVNYDACIGYAKNKGFYKASEVEGDEKLITKAKTNLGCTSLSSCRDYCSKEENYDKCHRFAQSTGVVGGYKEDPTSRALITQAKEALSCNSYESCHSFCENPANRDKCAEFARRIGINGGYEYRGPGGCTTAENCQAFCTSPSNIEICKQYSLSYGGKFVGPGGCTDEASCRSYCSKNPQACSVSGYQSTYYDPQIMCNKTPSCKWENNSCKCGYYEEADKNYDPAAKCKEYGCSWNSNYCSCSTSDSGYLERQKATCLQYPSCNWSGSYCSCSQTNINYSADPATQCTKYSGCTWSGTSCQCSGSTYYTGNTMTREQQEATCKAGGGTCQWNNDICSCQGYQSPTSGSSSNTPYPGTSSVPSSTYYPTYSSTPVASSTTATSTPSSGSSGGTSDGSFCNDSDGGSYDTSGTCTDASGTHTDYCEGDTVRDWYCGGTWNGSSWSNRHCETGGYVCSSSGKQCSAGGCASVQGVKTKGLLQSLIDALGL